MKLIETMRARNGAVPLWALHMARLERSCTSLGIAFPELVQPRGGADRIIRLLVGSTGAASGERDVPVTAPIRLTISALPHPGYLHKTTRREAFTAALADAVAAGADDALLLTPEGFAAETARWGIYWWEADSLAAPDPSLGILPSVARARIEEIAGPIVPRRVEPAALGGRALFLANAARGIVEVAALHGESVPREGRTAMLQGRFWP
ncbi:MAG TPA: aminotransferase class IV [Gemmatimonadales bacterium]|nr:aminotransferase class IV [Gemmatimonadales bacterium]